MEDRKVVFCSCGAECLVLQKFTMEAVSKSACISDEDELCISLFRYSSYTRLYSIWKRIKYAWHVIWSGEPYCDQIILGGIEVKELIGWLTKKFKKDTK